MGLNIVPLSTEFFDSYYDCFCKIVAEKKYLSMSVPFPYEATIEFLRLSRDRCVPFLLVVNDDTVVGWADVQPISGISSAGTLGIGISDNFREKGIGSLLLETIMDLSKRLGYKRITLAVRISNLRAIHVYEKLGFIKTETVKDGVTTDNISEDIYIMGINL